VVFAAAGGRHDRVGVPLYLVYGKTGEPKVLPQLLTPGIVADALNDAAK
jgi:thiol:disulfide interchange protein